MKPISTCRSIVQTLEDNKVVPINMISAQCGACFGIFSVERLFAEKSGFVPTCPHCNEIVEFSKEQIENTKFAIEAEYEFKPDTK
jgi:Fe2+ or Zn2+ uptake regulation protein